jgi:hypothetical protein
MLYLPLVEGRQRQETDLLRTKRPGNVILSLVEAIQLQEADLLRTKRPGDVILAFSGRQTMTRSRSAEDKEAKKMLVGLCRT